MSCSRSIWLSLSCPELKASLLRLISSRLDSWGRRRRWYHISGNYHKLTRCWASPISVTSHDDTPVTGHSADNVIGCTRTRAPGLLSQTTYLADDLCSMQQQFLPCGDQSQDFPVRNIDWDCLCYNKLSLWLVTVHLLTLAPAPTWEPRVRKYWDMSELLRDERDARLMMMWHNTWPLTTSHSSPETRGRMWGRRASLTLPTPSHSQRD